MLFVTLLTQYALTLALIEPLCPRWLFNQLCDELRKNALVYGKHGIVKCFHRQVQNNRNEFFRELVEYDRKVSGFDRSVFQQLRRKEKFASRKLCFIFDMETVVREGRKEERRKRGRDMEHDDADRRAAAVEATREDDRTENEGEDRNVDRYEMPLEERANKRRRSIEVEVDVNAILTCLSARDDQIDRDWSEVPTLDGN